MGAGCGFITIANRTGSTLTAVAFKTGTTTQVGDPIVIPTDSSAYFNVDVSINYDIQITCTGGTKTVTNVNAIYNPTLTANLLNGLLSLL